LPAAIIDDNIALEWAWTAFVRLLETVGHGKEGVTLWLPPRLMLTLCTIFMFLIIIDGFSSPTDHAFYMDFFIAVIGGMCRATGSCPARRAWAGDRQRQQRGIAGRTGPGVGWHSRFARPSGSQR